MKLQPIQSALAKAGIQVVSTARINGCGTNVYLEGGGIFCLYDSGRFLLQGKPTLAETRLYEALVCRSEPKPVEPSQSGLQEWEEWLATHYSERQD